MEKWGKISFSIALICSIFSIFSIFSIVIVVYVIRISKESWKYRIDETECYERKGIIEEVQKGKKFKMVKSLNL